MDMNIAHARSHHTASVACDLLVRQVPFCKLLYMSVAAATRAAGQMMRLCTGTANFKALTQMPMWCDHVSVYESCSPFLKSFVRGTCRHELAAARNQSVLASSKCGAKHQSLPRLCHIKIVVRCTKLATAV